MSARVQAQAPSKDKLDYTLAEIDAQLTIISNILKFTTKPSNKQSVFRRADLWLDRRLEKTQDAS